MGEWDGTRATAGGAPRTAVFCDMDGTLLTPGHDLAPATCRAIAELGERGTPFAVVTSRGVAATYPVLERHDVRCSVVALGGGVVLDEGRTVVAHDGFSRATAQEVADFVEGEGLGLAWIAYSFWDWVTPDRSDPRVRHEEQVVMARSREGGIASIERDEVQKLLCLGSPEAVRAAEPRLAGRFPELTVVRSSDILIEVMPAHLSKAGAARFLCERWGVDPARAVAFGDNYNDVPMLEAVGRPYLMANAPAELLSRFANHAPSNDENGVARTLAELGLLG